MSSVWFSPNADCSTGFVGAVLVATGLLAVAAVLRVLVLRGAFGAVAVDLETVDLRGINVLACLLIHYKTKMTLLGDFRNNMKQKGPACQLV